MLPTSYQLPAAIVLLVGGIVACFFGYRLFRLVLAIFGPSDTSWMVGAALVGGLVGAGILIAAYFVGVALVGAGLGAVVANLAFSASGRDPHFLVIVFFAVAGAALSMYLQRYVVIVGTGFGGALTLIHGALALVGSRVALPDLGGSGVWLPYPLAPLPGQQWVPIAWVLVGLLGIAAQLGWTGGEKGRVGRRKKKSG